MSILRYVGYAAFFVLSFVVGLYLTFPWDVVQERVLGLVSKGSFNVSAASMRPSGMASFTFTDIVAVHKEHVDAPVAVDELAASVHILPLLSGGVGASVEASVAKGHIEAEYVDSKDTMEAAVQADGLQLDFLPIIGAVGGFPLSGKMSLDLDVLVGKTKPELTEGKVVLETKSLVLEKGAKLGMFPLPMDVELGDLKLEVPIEKGKAAFKKIQLKGADVELEIDGSIAVNYPLERSALNLSLGLKPTQKFLNANPLIGPILNNFSKYKSPSGLYTVAMKGSVQRPSMSPVRARAR